MFRKLSTDCTSLKKSSSLSSLLLGKDDVAMTTIHRSDKNEETSEENKWKLAVGDDDVINARFFF